VGAVDFGTPGSVFTETLAASKLPFLTIAETKEKTEEAKEFQVERI